MLGNRQVSTRNEALKVLSELGVQGDFLTKLRGMVNNPLATTLCKMGGIDKNALLKDLESLRGSSPTKQVNQPINDDLSRFRAELEGISKK